MDLNIVFSPSLAQQRYLFIILNPLSAWFKSKKPPFTVKGKPWLYFLYIDEFSCQNCKNKAIFQ